MDGFAVIDQDWNPHIAALMRRRGATVIPIFIHGRNGLFFQISGLISKGLQNLWILKQFPKMKNSRLYITIGKPLELETWSDIADDKRLINHFRDQVETPG